MSNKILTIGYLKKFTKGILRINKDYINLDDSYQVADSEILEGKFFPYFKDSENPRSIIAGLKLDSINNKPREYANENDIVLIYPKLKNILLSSDIINVSPCGEDVNLTTTAYYNVMVKKYNEEELMKRIEWKVNPILRSDNESFKISNHICHFESNLDNEQVKVRVTASYAFRNTVKTSSIELIQKPNTLSEWKHSYNTTDNIEIFGDNTLIGRDGGKCKINVIRTFTEHLIKTDSCGNIVQNKEVGNNKEDVTALSILSSTNSSYFNRKHDVIIASKQDINGSERTCIVTADYDGFSASLTITQVKGGVSSYSYTLSFVDGCLTNIKHLKNSLKCQFNIPIISFKNLLIDNKLVSSIPSYDLRFIKYDDWYNIYLNESISDGSTTILTIDIIENNKDITFDRESEIEIYNLNDVDNKIKLIIKQPSNSCINSSYKLIVSEDGEFTDDTIKSSIIEYKPLNTLYYEDGTTVTNNSIGNNTLKCEWVSTDSSILDGSVPRQIDFNGNFISKPNYIKYNGVSDVILHTTAYLVNNITNEIVTDKVCNTITLKGNDIITYEYSFKLDSDNIYKELIWDYNDMSSKQVSIKSIESNLLNGIVTSENFIKYDYEPIEDLNFKIEKNEDDVVFTPTKSNLNEISLNHIVNFKQDKSNNIIKVNLIQNGKPKYNYINLKLSVSVHKDDISEDIWADYDSQLIVTDIDDDNKVIKIIPLNKWWLYPLIQDNHDIIFNGECNFILGHNYNFRIEKLINTDLDYDDISYVILNETYLIEPDDLGIDLIVNI